MHLGGAWVKMLSLLFLYVDMVFIFSYSRINRPAFNFPEEIGYPGKL